MIISFSLPVPGRSSAQPLHLGEYDTCLEAVYAYDHALIGIRNWLLQTGKPQLPIAYKANLQWSDYGAVDTLSGSPDMYGTPLYNYLLTMASPAVETALEKNAADAIIAAENKATAKKEKKERQLKVKQEKKETREREKREKKTAKQMRAKSSRINPFPKPRSEESEQDWWFQKLLNKNA